MKILLIGSGGWGFNHLKTLISLPEVKEVMVADLSEKVLNRVRQSFPDVKVSLNYRELIKEADGVIIATPAETHYTIGKEVLEEFKKPALIEKPLALKVKQAKELVEIARTYSIPLVVGHLLLYHPGIQKIKDLIELGELGDIFYLHFQRVNLGKIRRVENVLWSLAPHDVSIALYLLNRRVLSVRAIGDVFIQKEKGIEDVAFIDLEFEDGVYAHIHVSWLDPHKVRMLKVVGSKKMIVFDDVAFEEKIKIYDKGVDWEAMDFTSSIVAVRYGDIYSPKLPFKEPLKEEIKDFLRAIREGKSPLSDGELAVRITDILEKAESSMKEGGIKIEV